MPLCEPVAWTPVTCAGIGTGRTASAATGAEVLPDVSTVRTW